VSGLYLDTSVLVAYYTPEVFSAQAETIIVGATDRVVSPLCLSEANAALRAKVFQGCLSQADATAARDRFRAHYAGGFYRTVQLDEQAFDLAAAIVWHIPVKIRTLDALHVVAAQSAGLRLATADARMRDAAQAAQVMVQWAGN
jgi:uncharacterized protein